MLLIVFLVLLLFGARKLPELGRSLGVGMRGFKEGLSDSGDEESERRELARVDASAETPARSTSTGVSQ